MWRSFFLAIGFSLLILGAECLVVEEIHLGASQAPTAATGYDQEAENAAVKKVGPIRPPEWAPWSLMAAGTVVMIYSFTIPARVKN